MSKTLGMIAVVGAVLTVITLVLDLPGKVADTYHRVTMTPPDIKVNALFANQDTLTVNAFTDDKKKGYSHFTWPAVYELHNISNQDVTINRITNLLSEIKLTNHKLHLKPIEEKSVIIVLYDSFQSLTAKEERGVTERLPYTLKAGTKLYMKVFGDYKVEYDGQHFFCESKSRCSQLLAFALGVVPKKDGKFPCVLKDFKTKVEVAKFRDITTDQRAILLIEGCSINLNALDAAFMDKIMIEKKK